MKPFKFKTKATVLKGVKEEAPKRKTNWDRIIYLIIFVIIFVSILYYAISRSFYVKISGHVHTEQFTVSFPEDVSVYNYFVNEQDTIDKGDTLFYYRLNLLEDQVISSSIKSSVPNKADWYIKERLQTQKEISLNFITIADIKNQVNRIRQEYEKTKKEVYLDIYPQTVLKKYSEEIDRLEVQLDKKEQEIAYLKEYLTLLDYYQEQANKPIIENNEGEVILWNYYRSPVDGIISKIYSDPEEVIYKKDVIMYIHDFEKVHILGFIEQGDIDQFKVGEELRINFPSGIVSTGVINKFYINTEEIPSDFIEPKGRYKRHVVVLILPKNEEVANEWIKHNLYEVQIKKFRYF